MGVTRTVKYEEELDPEFASFVAARPGGESFWDCIQCGTCSATCPVSLYMDRTPRQLIGMVRGGFRHEVLSSITPWLCTSCYSCTVECPAGIRITDLMYVLKREAMRHPRYRRFLIPKIETTFVRMVGRHGRLSESRMGLSVARRAGIRSLLEMVPMGWKLWRRGRMRLRQDSMEDPESLRIVLRAMVATRAGRPAREGAP